MNHIKHMSIDVGLEDIINQLDNLKKEEPGVIVLNYSQLPHEPIDDPTVLISDLRTAPVFARINKPISTPIFEQINGHIYDHILILISRSYGSNASIPDVFLKLCHLNSYFNTQLQEIDDSDDEYYLNILVPDKPTKPKGDMVICFCCEDNKKYIKVNHDDHVDDNVSYGQLLSTIVNIYNDKLDHDSFLYNV